MKARTRKLVGGLGLIFGLLLYIAVVSWIATAILPQSVLIQLLFYLVAGIAWALPLRPVLIWMNRPD